MITKDHILNLVRNKNAQIGAASAVSFVAGGGLAYLVTKKKLTTKFEALMNEEIRKAKDHYVMLQKTGDHSDPVKLAESKGLSIEVNKDEVTEIEGVVKDLGYVSSSEAPEDPEVTRTEYHKMFKSQELNEAGEEVTKHIFENRIFIGDKADIDDSVEEYLLGRDTTVPHIITHDEFFENETDYDQLTISYFEADGVLVDDHEEVIPEQEETVGEHALKNFGFLSKDANVVYVRNPKIETDFEVTRSTGSYAVEVLGLDPR